MDFALPAYDYTKVYRGVLRIDTAQGATTITITKQDTLTLSQRVPIDPLGLKAVRLSIDSIKSVLRRVRHGNGEYPVIFVFNPNYGKLNPLSNVSVAYLGGAALLEDTNDVRYMVGYSRARTYVNNAWSDATVCRKGKNLYTCRLYFTLLVDDRLVDAIPSNGMVNLRVEVDGNNGLEASNITLYVIDRRSVKVYDRAFTALNTYPQDCVTTQTGNAELSLCPGDAEVMHLGSQLMLRGYADYIRDGIRSKWYTYYVMPIVVSYPVKLPQNTNDVALPIDRVFRTAVLRLDIKGFNWNEALRLVDWLWSSHRDALFKLFLNIGVIESLRSMFSRGNIHIPPIEYTVTTKLYDKFLINYSLVLEQFLELYYQVRKSHSSIVDLIKDILRIYGIGNVRVTQNDEENVRKVLAIYALVYGLHGISHLLMKALTVVTGFRDYGELINVTVDVSGLPDTIVNTLSRYLLSSNGGIYSENVFHVMPGSEFKLTVEVFSRSRFTFDYFKSSLVDSSGSIDAERIKDAISRLLIINGDDRCAHNWHLERGNLRFGRLRFINNDQLLSDIDSRIGDLISRSLYKPPRSLFRLLFGRRLIRDLVNNSGLTSQSEKDDPRRRINRFAQFMWPYHLEQCIDGCYSCVIMERSIRSSTCDMPPFTQELKTSKWAALYLLKYAGLFNAPWL